MKNFDFSGLKYGLIVLAAVVLASVAISAFAGGQDHTCQGGHNCNSTGGASATATGGNAEANATGGNASVKSYNDIRNSNTNLNVQGQQQGQVQGQKQGQAQGQTQSATVGNSGNNTGTASNSTTLTFNEERQAVAAFAPAMNTTASCRVGVGVGVGAAVGGVSIGGAYKDEDCDAREKGRMLIESARIAHSMGAPQSYTAPLFMEGLALIRGGDAKKSVPPVATAAAFESYTQ